jgi:prevent-host-death family protein
MKTGKRPGKMPEVGEIMPTIRPSADLRNNYNEISELCHEYAEPVFITKNGTGDIAVMSIETYEDLIGKRKLYDLLEDGINILTEEEMDKELDIM